MQYCFCHATGKPSVGSPSSLLQHPFSISRVDLPDDQDSLTKFSRSLTKGMGSMIGIQRALDKK